MKRVTLGALVAAAFITTTFAQTYKLTTPIAPGGAVPDRIESSIGTLNWKFDRHVITESGYYE